MEKKKLTGVQIGFTVLFLLLGILCVIYGITVYLVNSGSRFYMVWFGLAVCMWILSAFSYFRVFSKIPKPLLIILIVIVTLCVAFFAFVEARILKHFHDNGPEGLDYIIVLGAQMKDSGPSLVLQFRLDTAIEYLENNPDTICIVSGGQGRNESAPEADGMKKYLLEHGISEERIIVENQSSNTIENILYSKKLINSEEASIGIVTNNFHVYRGLALARKQGLATTYGISAPSTATYLPNNMLREFVGVMKDTLLGNMSFKSLK